MNANEIRRTNGNKGKIIREANGNADNPVDRFAPLDVLHRKLSYDLPLMFWNAN